VPETVESPAEDRMFDVAADVTLLYSTGQPVLMFLVFGVAAGALTGIPIGPVNVAVIDASYRHTMRRAIGVGLGGAIADAFYAGLGIIGVTPVLQKWPSVPPILYSVSGIVLLVYGFLTARSQPVTPAVPETPISDSELALKAKRELGQGMKVGVALILLNPAAMVTWVVIIGQLLPTIDNNWEGLACAIGVFAGSFGWFALVAYLTHKGKHVLGDKAAWIPRLVGVALMGYALWLLFKAVKIVIA
jgi:threonine/homoserine/homoserine lactone efflux protein